MPLQVRDGQFPSFASRKLEFEKYLARMTNERSDIRFTNILHAC